MNKQEILADIYNNCSEDNWDGYKGEAVSKEAIEDVKSLIRIFPDNLIDYDLFPCCNGRVHIEFNLPRKFLIMFMENEEIVFAAIINRAKCNGSIPFKKFYHKKMVDELIWRKIPIHEFKKL